MYVLKDVVLPCMQVFGYYLTIRTGWKLAVTIWQNWICVSSALCCKRILHRSVIKAPHTWSILKKYSMFAGWRRSERWNSCRKRSSQGRGINCRSGITRGPRGSSGDSTWAPSKDSHTSTRAHWIGWPFRHYLSNSFHFLLQRQFEQLLCFDRGAYMSSVLFILLSDYA